MHFLNAAFKKKKLPAPRPPRLCRDHFYQKSGRLFIFLHICIRFSSFFLQIVPYLFQSILFVRTPRLRASISGSASGPNDPGRATRLLQAASTPIAPVTLRHPGALLNVRFLPESPSPSPFPWRGEPIMPPRANQARPWQGQESNPHPRCATATNWCLHQSLLA